MPTSTDGPPLSSEAVDLDQRIELYRMMMEARRFEELAHRMFLEGLVKGTSHLAVGQEAIAAAFALAMRPGDLSFCTYRGHNHTLLRGASPGRLMAEMFGRESGVCGGKGGSMHLTDASTGAMGSYAIVGAHLPIAVGAAWAASERESGQVAVCFFGDGATNIGAFHEALNIAVVWSVPVVFVCENNQYMEYTPIRSVTAVKNPAADRAVAYGLDPILVDGNDADLMFDTARSAIERARSGGGPSLIEAATYRHGGHSRADPGDYRPDEEVAEWKARDPIPAYRERLLEAGASSQQLDDVEAAATRVMNEAVEEAKAAPEPSVSVIGTNLWADGGSAWRN